MPLIYKTGPIRGTQVKHTFLNDDGDRGVYVLEAVGNGLFELEMHMIDGPGPDAKRSTYSLLVNVAFMTELQEGIGVLLTQHGRNPL